MKDKYLDTVEKSTERDGGQNYKDQFVVFFFFLKRSLMGVCGSNSQASSDRRQETSVKLLALLLPASLCRDPSYSSAVSSSFANPVPTEESVLAFLTLAHFFSPDFVTFFISTWK